MPMIRRFLLKLVVSVTVAGALLAWYKNTSSHAAARGSHGHAAAATMTVTGATPVANERLANAMAAAR
jgi:hypothetical protein